NMFDPETGHNWFWHGQFYCNQTAAGSAYTGTQLRAQSWLTLEGRVSDSAWVGFFHLFTPVDRSIYRFWAGGTEMTQALQGVPGGWYPLSGAGYFPADQLQIDSLSW